MRPIPHMRILMYSHTPGRFVHSEKLQSQTRVHAHTCAHPHVHSQGRWGVGLLRTLSRTQCVPRNSWHIICLPSPRLLGSFPDAVLWSFLSPSRELGGTEVVSPD